MIKLDVLDGMKLVGEENIATTQQAADVLERAIAQGSQGWGVRQEEAVILRLGLELRIAQSLAGDTVDTKNQLKGLQLENGRLKKKILVLDGAAIALARSEALNVSLTARLADIEDQLRECRAQLDGAYASNAVEADGDYKVDAS